MKKIILYLLALLPVRLMAGDYVAEINAAPGKNAEGCRVIYEMNVGMFTSEGTFSAASQQLDELKNLGIDSRLILCGAPIAVGVVAYVVGIVLFKTIKSRKQCMILKPN